MRRSSTTILASVIVFMAAWWAFRPALEQPPTSDLFGHLCVTRHLAQGDGFVNDIVYPASLAFPFAADVPQPLIHRPPGYAMLLLGPYLVSGGEPRSVLTAVRWFHLSLLVGCVVVGLLILQRQRQTSALPAWLLLLFFSPGLYMSVAWCRVEIPVALILMLLWARWRSGFGFRGDVPTGPTGRSAVFDIVPIGVLDGVLAAMLCLLRGELCWIPLIWWIAGRRHRARRATCIAAGVGLLMLLPWGVRNLQLTGNPVFSLQAHTEHLKQTEAWPEYSIYRSLAPESFGATLIRQPELLLSKFRSGIRFYATNLGAWLPWSLWIVCGGLVGRLWWEARRDGGQQRRENKTWWRTPGIWRAPLVLSLLTAGLLTIQYAVFSHTVRHLVVLLPIVLLEICLATARWLESVPWVQARGRQSQLAVAAVLVILVLATQLATPARLPGWVSTLTAAEQARPGLIRAVAAADSLPPGPIFTDSAALLWYSGRAGVWSPLNAAVIQEIRDRVPAMATAPVVEALSPVD
ncbi:MAG: hypothetical protein ABIF77_07545 [bacterium]